MILEKDESLGSFQCQYIFFCFLFSLLFLCFSRSFPLSSKIFTSYLKVFFPHAFSSSSTLPAPQVTMKAIAKMLLQNCSFVFGERLKAFLCLNFIYHPSQLSELPFFTLIFKILPFFGQRAQWGRCPVEFRGNLCVRLSVRPSI